MKELQIRQYGYGGLGKQIKKKINHWNVDTVMMWKNDKYKLCRGRLDYNIIEWSSIVL